MTTYHVLNGDAMRVEFEKANVPGQMIVFREALIDGDLSGDTLPGFLSSRSKYMGISSEEYQQTFVSEISKILNASDDSEFNLWFEYDLFCQVNMWFLLSIIDGLKIKKKVFAVYSSYLSRDHKNFWNGLGPAYSNELVRCFSGRIALSEDEIKFGRSLWMAYQKHDLDRLKVIGNKTSPSFPYLKEVITAHLDRFPTEGNKSRVETVVEKIIKSGSGEFEEVFREFWRKESIYGFGDIQFKHIYDKVVRKSQSQ